MGSLLQKRKKCYHSGWINHNCGNLVLRLDIIQEIGDLPETFKDYICRALQEHGSSLRSLTPARINAGSSTLNMLGQIGRSICYYH